MTRRIAKFAAVYLLLGLVATWVVAWGSAMSWQPNWRSVYYHSGDSPPYRLFVRRTCPGGESIYLDHVTLYTAEEQARRWDRLSVAAEDRRFGDVPPLAADLLASEPIGPFREVLVLTARGWPWRALLWVTQMDGSYFANQARYSPNGAWCPIAVFDDSHNRPPPPITTGCIQVTSDNGVWHTGKRLPLLPYWPGLIADTLFYAVLFAGVHQFVGLTRRRRRKRRGLCVRCGYDLSGLGGGTCPECGALE